MAASFGRWGVIVTIFTGCERVVPGTAPRQLRSSPWASLAALLCARRYPTLMLSILESAGCLLFAACFRGVASPPRTRREGLLIQWCQPVPICRISRADILGIIEGVPQTVARRKPEAVRLDELINASKIDDTAISRRSSDATACAIAGNTLLCRGNGRGPRAAVAAGMASVPTGIGPACKSGPGS